MVRWTFIGAIALAPAGAAGAGPVVDAQVSLSAQPAALSSGPSGPLNRVAFDVRNFDPRDPRAVVSCHYPAGLVYRCLAEPDANTAGGPRRITVTIPDLAQGERVTVRFESAAGHSDVPIRLANGPHVVHEIEALPLPGGGATTVRGDGVEQPVRQLATHRATTTPALATSEAVPAGECERVFAEWVTASATDPVFTSRFGPLNGSLAPSRPVPRGARVTPYTLPEWLISFPLGATRVQFIAHYEVVYRVAPCAGRVVAGWTTRRVAHGSTRSNWRSAASISSSTSRLKAAKPGESSRAAHPGMKRGDAPATGSATSRTAGLVRGPLAAARHGHDADPRPAAESRTKTPRRIVAGPSTGPAARVAMAAPVQSTQRS